MTTGFLFRPWMTASIWSATWPTFLPAKTSGCAFASETVSGSSGHPGFTAVKPASSNNVAQRSQLLGSSQRPWMKTTAVRPDALARSICSDSWSVMRVRSAATVLIGGSFVPWLFPPRSTAACGYRSQVIDPEVAYRETTARSRALHERALTVMPGGTTRTTTYFAPYPLYIERGEGCRVWDVDGTERIDMIGNYTAMILGHSHPKVVEAIRAQAARGTGFAAANPVEVELAALLCERIPSVDAVRFCNSGTEATMFAMRLARAFTGRR